MKYSVVTIKFINRFRVCKNTENKAFLQLNKMSYKKMDAKKILVSFIVLASILLLASTVSAAGLTNNVLVEVNDVAVARYNGTAVTALDQLSVVAGETLAVKVYVTAEIVEPRTSNVKIEAEIEGNEETVDASTASFDMEDGKTYVKTMTLKVPTDFEESELSNDFTLSFKIWNSNYKSEFGNILLRVQKPSYDVDVKSVTVSNSVEAGKSIPVDIVLKNVGYNDLEDVYVSVKIADLGVEKTSFFGDLVAIETDNDEDTASGRLYLDVPFDVESGLYTLEVKVESEDLSAKTVSKQISVENGFPEIAMKSGDNLLLLNPTDQLRVYRVVYQTKEATVVVPAGESKTIPVEFGATDAEFDVFVFSGDKLLSTVKFSGSEASAVTSPIIVLTVILAIVFLVLLVVLIVLMTKKPQKTEEFGESYY